MVVVTGLVPVALDRDSFPLSTFPMFSSRRTSTERVDTAVAVLADGSVRRLSPERIGGTDEVILAGATVSRAVASGGAAGLCAEIAARVAAGGPSGAVRVEVVSETFDAVAWYDGRRDPLARTVHADCRVP